LTNVSEAIQSVTAAGYAAARNALGRAFRDYVLMAYAGERLRDRGPAVTSLYGAIMNDCWRHGEVYRSSDGQGVACWLPPARSTPTLWRQIRGGMYSLPWHFGLRGFRILNEYDQVARRLHHDHAPMPHYYLAAIGVVPAAQGQGIGSALMRPMLERADREGLHVWLDTHPEQNVRLYERHGFIVSERAELPGHPIPVYGMLRKPR
jgi:ribosomal protein S18 acetylase RimI-like enzyme